MSKPPHIIALCGSQRRRSYNRMLMNTALHVLTPHAHGEVIEWGDVPPFDSDHLEAHGLPAPVQRVRQAIATADGVLIVTPEYNFALPGMFKNLLDWTSRGHDQPFARKPVALLSATTGPLGGARVQNEARRVMLFLNAMVMQKPEVYVGHAAAKFDEQGQCTDELTLRFLTEHAGAFLHWIRDVGRMHPAA